MNANNTTINSLDNVLPPGVTFLCKPGTIGITDADIESLKLAGRLPGDRVETIRHGIRAAFERLLTAPIEGSC